VGRYPKVNAFLGKDHWPKNSWVMVGAGLRPVEGGITVGATDENLRGQAVDFRSGSLTSGDRRPIFLESVFATLLKMVGAAPAVGGYRADSVLDCIVG
jgi:hypothetical protein